MCNLCLECKTTGYQSVPDLWKVPGRQTARIVKKKENTGAENDKQQIITEKERMRVESPEVVHELFEFVGSLGQRQHNVNGHVGRLHQLTFHFHEGAEGAEENQPAKLLLLLSTEGQLVQRALVLLSACNACRDEKTLRRVKKRNHFTKHPHVDAHKQSKISKKSKAQGQILQR